LLDAAGNYDPTIGRFMASGAFSSLAEGTQHSYTLDYRLFFSFLAHRNKSWREATPDDIDDYEHWRRRDEANPSPIGGSRWNRGIAAINRLYEWAVTRGELIRSPILKHTITTHDRRTAEVPTALAHDARSADVKWLTPRAYRKWRDIGLRGYNKEGLLREDYRGRCDARDASFTDFMKESGLRRRELGALFKIELPEISAGVAFPHGYVPYAIAKRAQRYFWVSRRALSAAYAYCSTTRAQAVKQAQQTGKYQNLRNKIIATVSNDRRTIMYSSRGEPRRVPLDAVDARMRQSLFLETADGLEPLQLWLTETGLPMGYTSWNVVFRSANERCHDAGLDLWCTPKMLRHSFALQMLVSIQYAFIRRLGLDKAERDYITEIYGDAWSLVKDLLGHRSIETTKSIYLEPVSGLRLDALFTGDVIEDVSDLIIRVAEHKELILDLTR